MTSPHPLTLPYVPFGIRRFRMCNVVRRTVESDWYAVLRRSLLWFAPEENSALPQSPVDSPLPPEDSFLTEFSAVDAFLSSLPFHFPHIHVQPFPAVLFLQVVWPLLTPGDPAEHLCPGCQHSWRLQQASPGKNIIFPFVYPPYLLSAAFGNTDFALLSKLIQLPLASPGVRGPRAPRFAAGFLRIPPHGGHPCLKLRLLLPSSFGTFTL